MNFRVSVNLFIFAILYFILTFEGMYLPLLYAIGFDASVVKLLLYLKYIVIVFYVSKLSKHMKVLNYESIIYAMLILLMGFVVFQALTFSKFSINIITVQLFPFLLYIAGRKMYFSDKYLNSVRRIISWGAFILSVYAILDIKLLSGDMWSGFLNQGGYLKDIKNTLEDGIVFNLTGNFYYDPFNLKIRRAIGFQGDPLAFAYSLVLPFLLIIFERKNYGNLGKVIILLVGMALWLSYTRAIIISIVLITICHIVFKKKQIIVTICTGIFVMFVIALFGNQLLLLTGASDSSSMGHVESLVSVLHRDASSFVLGGIISGERQLHTYESGFLNLFVNYGILVAFGYYYCISKIVLKLYDIDTNFSKALALTGSIGAFTSIIFSESFFSFTGYGLFWFLSGIVITNNYYNVKHTTEDAEEISAQNEQRLSLARDVL